MPAAAAGTQFPQPEATEHHERVRAYEIAAYLSAASFPFDIAPGPPINPVPSNDLTLNALVQHGAHTMQCDRAFLSLIDNRSQYICAEMTRQQPLAFQNPDRPLLLGTSRIPLEWGVCPYTMSVFHGNMDAFPPNPSIVADPSFFYIKDFREIPSFAVRPYVAGYPKMVSYIEVPLRSLSGHILGSYCVVDDRPRDFLAPASLEQIREAALAISSYLNLKRAELSTVRSVRMMDGLNQFIASEKSVSSLKHKDAESGNGPPGPFDLGLFRSPSDSGPDQAENYEPSSQLPHSSHAFPGQPGDDEQRPLGSHTPLETETTSSVSPTPGLSNDTNSMGIRHDSVVRNHKDTPHLAASQKQREPESDKPKASSPAGHLFARAAKTIGFALDVDGLVFFDTARSSALRSEDYESPLPTTRNRTTSIPYANDMASNILSEYRSDSRVGTQLVSTPSQSLIQRLTARYPQGHVFVADEYGVMNYDAGHEDAEQQAVNSSAIDNDQKEILECIPEPRYAIFLPLWHYQRESCFATCLVWVSDTAKSLDSGDVNSLTAFGNSLMVEILRLEALANAQSKSDFISSISHELRSPLHGIMATTELMQETTDDKDLLSMMDMIESCTSTLLDTFDHLLEFSRINSRAQDVSREHSDSGNESSTRAKRDNLDLADLLEDMVELVSLGHSHSSQMNSKFKVGQQHGLSSTEPLRPLNNVLITTHIETSCDWKLPLDVGAWKRMILNLFSNALKYTDSGFIDIELKMTRPDSGSRYMTFSVTDTGIGMSREFAKYHIFTAFMQENNLSPGTGLGLSLVKSIVDSLGGMITVQSRQHEGSRFTIDIPVDEGPETSGVPSEERLSTACDTLRGLSLSLVSLSFPPPKSMPSQDVPLIVCPMDVLQKSVRNICQKLLDMTVLEPVPDTIPETDIVILDTLAIASTERVNWTQFFSDIFSGRQVPAVVVLGPKIEMSEQYPGMENIIYTNSPVTGKKLTAALLAARKIRDASPNSDVQHLSERLKTVALQDGISKAALKSTSKEDGSPLSKSLSFEQPLNHILRDVPRSKAGSASTISSRFNRFLLVDDNPINLRVLAAFIGRLKRPFSFASDGAEAVQLYRDAWLRDGAPYDCIFMDISMPIMDGFEAITEIRRFEQQISDTQADVSHGSLPRSYILALTGLGSGEARRAARDSGVDGFLLKPVKFKDIMPLL